MHQEQGLKEYTDVWHTKSMVQKAEAEKERRGISQRASLTFLLDFPYMVGQGSAQSCWSSKGGSRKWTETRESPATHLSCAAVLVPKIQTHTEISWTTWPWLASGPGSVVHLPEDFFSSSIKDGQFWAPVSLLVYRFQHGAIPVWSHRNYFQTVLISRANRQAVSSPLPWHPHTLNLAPLLGRHSGESLFVPSPSSHLHTWKSAWLGRRRSDKAHLQILANGALPQNARTPPNPRGGKGLLDSSLELTKTVLNCVGKLESCLSRYGEHGERKRQYRKEFCKRRKVQVRLQDIQLWTLILWKKNI